GAERGIRALSNLTRVRPARLAGLGVGRAVPSRAGGSQPTMQAHSSANPAWSWEVALSGIVPPMISPLTEDGLVDVVSVGNVVEHLLRGGCSGLFVVGGCGEGAWLAASERGLTIEATVAAARGRVPILAGCMLPGTAPTLDAVRQAEAAGAD